MVSGAGQSRQSSGHQDPYAFAFGFAAILVYFGCRLLLCEPLTFIVGMYVSHSLSYSRMRMGRDGMAHTVADDLPTVDEDEHKDYMENAQRGQLVRTIPRDETALGAHARFGIVYVVRCIRSLHLEYVLVCHCSTLNEHRVECHPEDVCL